MAVDVREKLVKQAISHFWYGVSHDIFSEPVTTYAKLAIEALEKEKESGVTVQEWISVKDRLPEDDPTVKKHIEGEKFGFLTVLVYNGVVKETNRFFSNEPRYGLPKTNGWEWASSNVTHWMPLPQPPKEGNHGKL